MLRRQVRSIGCRPQFQRHNAGASASQCFRRLTRCVTSWMHVEEAVSLLQQSKTVFRTPLLESPVLNRLVAALPGACPTVRVLVKAESLQVGGSFKVRGALAAMHRLKQQERERGVVAFSSGNFAQGLALAARELGVQATVVMPHDAPALKRERTESYGARVVLARPANASENRELSAGRMAAKLAEDQGLTLMHPFNSHSTVAGQGTVAWEIAEQAVEAGASELDALLVCTGGGGLVAGCAVGMAHKMPSCTVHSVEPEAYDGLRRSLEAGRVVGAPDAAADTCCDALQAPAPGDIPLGVLSGANGNVGAGLAVTDAEVVAAMRVAFDALKLVLEPGGAAALAALLANKLPMQGLQVVAVVASGGNVSWEKFKDLYGR